MKNKRRPASINQKTWLVTFNDLITLLLTFFVLILSVSTINRESLQIFSSSFHDSVIGLGGQKVQVFQPFVKEYADQDISRKIREDEARKIKELIELQQKLSERFREAPVAGLGIKIALVGDRLSIMLPEAALFDPAGAEIRKSEVILFLAENIRTIDGIFTVECHTDDAPHVSKKYPSNWELSATRAVNVLNMLTSVGGIEPRRLSAVGYAHVRPLVANDSPQGKEVNRRVNIVITLNNK